MALTSEQVNASQDTRVECELTDKTKDRLRSFYQLFPEMKNTYKIIKEVGQGAFGWVFLAQLRLPSGELSEQKFALKYIVPTSHPKRIVSELRCLHELRNEENIINVVDCMRSNENVVLVMPYFPHDHFSDCIRDMTVDEARKYMLHLMTALRQVHHHGIIHRDVKPNNFLYCRKSQRYMIIDFGLAQKADTITSPQPVISKSSSSSFVKIEDAQKSTGRISISNVKRKGIENQENKSLTKKKAVSLGDSKNVLKPNMALANTQTPKAHVVTTSRLALHTSNQPSCHCYGQPYVCSKCLERKVEVAHRAGTPGFRPPEVLMKSSDQTTAIDMWSAGVIFLCILSGRYPFFTASNDMTAIAEIASLLGFSKIKSAASSMNKYLLLQPDSQPAMDLKSLCEKLQDTNLEHPSPQFPDSAYHLLYQLLDANPKTRITAAEALRHPFFTET